MPRTRTKTDPATWTHALTRFADHLVEQEKSDHTQKNYREDLLAFTDWYQQTYQERPDLRALAPSELRAWKAHLRDTQKLEPATVNRKLAALRSFLNWAAAEGLAAELVTPKSIKQIKPPPRWLDRRQQRALVRAVERYGSIRDIALVALLLHTGLRVAELAALRWTDLEVRDRSGKLTVRRGKGRKQRTIPLNVEARNALIELRAIRELRGKGKAAAVLQGQRGPLTGKRTVKPVLPRLLSCWVGPLSPTQEPAHGTPQRSQARTRLAATPPTADLKRPLDPRVLRT